MFIKLISIEDDTKITSLIRKRRVDVETYTFDNRRVGLYFENQVQQNIVTTVPENGLVCFSPELTIYGGLNDY